MMAKNSVKNICEKAKRASRALALVDTKAKDRALEAMAGALRKNASYISGKIRKILRLREREACLRSSLTGLRLMRSASPRWPILSFKSPD